MKNFFLLPAVLIVLLSGCPVDSDSGGRQTSFGLEGTVWAASRAADQDDWLTLAFRAESENPRHGRDAVLAFASDSDAPEFSHVSAAAEYSYDEGTRAGSVTGIGDFSVDGEGKIIRFGDFKSEGPQELKRLYPDAGNVFTLITPLPADLAKTVWASGGLRSNDWVTLAFRDSQFVAVSHMADNTQWPRGYTYNDAEKKGSIDYLGYRDGGFSVNGDTLRIANFYGHGGAVDLQRVR